MNTVATKRTVIGIRAMRIPKSPMPEGLRGRSPSPPPSPRPRGNGALGGPFGPPVVGSDGLSGASISTVSVFNAGGMRGALAARRPASGHLNRLADAEPNPRHDQCLLIPCPQ